MKTKTCFKCGEDKPLSEFYEHKQMADGHLNKCKECAKVDTRSNRAKHKEYYDEYDRQRGCLPHRVSARDLYAKSEAGILSARKARSNYIKKNQRKRKAHQAVNNAVRDGRLVRPDRCSVCETECVPHGHHDSYEPENWLDVEWVCVNCHVDIHHE